MNTTNYVSDNLERNELNRIYFSKNNINYLQKKIIKRIYNLYKYEISEQSYNHLLNIMRDIYVAYSKNSYRTEVELRNELNKLNMYVIKYCVDNIKKNIDDYVYYIDNIDKNSYEKKVIPMSKPVNTRTSKELKFNDLF